ncbi:MAG: glutaredoxin domain-containing protein [Candidatus Korobacteraceae bacterium]|jgi:glutaredoxin
MTTRKIIVFTQPDSLPCEAVKLFLKDRKAKFEERCVTDGKDALRELAEKYNSRSIPTVVIDDEVVVGFDPERLDQLFEQ